MNINSKFYRKTWFDFIEHLSNIGSVSWLETKVGEGAMAIVNNALNGLLTEGLLRNDWSKARSISPVECLQSVPSTI
jgi:hypothetical protein